MDDTLEHQVRAELLAIRKTRRGLTVAALTHAPVLTSLLGLGDPKLAYNQLMRQILGSDLDITVQAAAASLGLSSHADTHLGRLDAFGSEVHLDQRQVRRYSDKGIRTLARLVSTSWTTEGVPALDVIVVRSGADEFTIAITTHRLLVVEMQPVRLTLSHGPTSTELPYESIEPESDEDWWVHQVPVQPLIVQLVDETSLRIVWRGEMWPKFGVRWQGEFGHSVASECLGNTLMLRLS